MISRGQFQATSWKLRGLDAGHGIVIRLPMLGAVAGAGLGIALRMNVLGKPVVVVE